GFDLDVVDDVLHNAPFVLARGFAADQQGNLDLNPLARIDPQEVDVDQVLLEGVPLDVLQQGLAGGGALELDDLVAVANRGPQLIGRDDDADRLFAVAVNDPGELPFKAQPMVPPLPREIPLFNLQRIG